ncbi:hypothetical protein [Muricoccus aerilatus]|uniref:hypothetical protein n=1 Tax=Muricoccus aerilatus TaxID=452982 RepID=UPI0005C21358|nr:hypothetical protein [Roseomonas aerilata]
MRPSIKLTLVPNAMDEAGEQLAALEVPPEPGSTQRRPMLRVFGSIALAIAAKAEVERRL